LNLDRGELLAAVLVEEAEEAAEAPGAELVCFFGLELEISEVDVRPGRRGSVGGAGGQGEGPNGAGSVSGEDGVAAIAGVWEGGSSHVF
jgi:hypothetical protein